MATKTKKVNPLSAKAVEILDVLKVIQGGTMKEIKANGAPDIVSGHFTALKARGYVTVEKIEISCSECGHKEKDVAFYTITELGKAYGEVAPASDSDSGLTQ